MKKDYSKVFNLPVSPQTIKSAPCTPLKTTPFPSSQKKMIISSLTDSFHSTTKVPNGDSPYVKAKHVQLVERDPNKAIPLFWSAINCGDRVDSAVKDMALVMKQLDRSEEAIQAIKSFRSLCSQQAQASLDNVLIDLYKRAGRIDEHIKLLEHKLQLVEDGGGKQTKITRDQGKKFHCSIEQEKSRLLGNLGWAYMRQENYKVAEEMYRKALSIEPDKNKQCNLAICLMHMGRYMEARSLLQTVKPSVAERELADYWIKSFDRATEMLSELELAPVLKPIEQKIDDNIKMGYQGSFTSPVKVNSKSRVTSRYEDKENNEPVENSHPRVSPSNQHHGFGGKWNDSPVRVFTLSGQHQKHGFEVKWKAENSPFSVSVVNFKTSQIIPWILPGSLTKEESTVLEEYSGSEAADNLMRSTPMSQEGINGSNFSFGNWKPFSSSMSKKSWADMAEEEEEDRLSRFSGYSPSMVGSVDKWYEKIEAVNNTSGEFRNSAARRSLHFDQKQEQESSARYSYTRMLR